MVVEDGKIIGLVHVVRDWRGNSDGARQSALICDVLFELEPETGETSILYRTENNQTRVIGYQDGMIYLFRDNKIYRRPVNGRKRNLLYTLPEVPSDIMFDWQGDCLLILNLDRRDFGVIAAVPVKQDM